MHVFNLVLTYCSVCYINLCITYVFFTDFTIALCSVTIAEISPPQCDHDQFGDCFSNIVQSVYHLNEGGILLTDEDEDSICR